VGKNVVMEVGRWGRLLGVGGEEAVARESWREIGQERFVGWKEYILGELLQKLLVFNDFVEFGSLIADYRTPREFNQKLFQNLISAEKILSIIKKFVLKCQTLKYSKLTALFQLWGIYLCSFKKFSSNAFGNLESFSRSPDPLNPFCPDTEFKKIFLKTKLMLPKLPLQTQTNFI
jgi:hypothetical protein